jgi:phage terminase large subunit
MIRQTTALRKVSALKKKIVVLQGGQVSSKTYSILMLLINHASSHQGKEILILSAELTKMRLTVIKDFVKIMRSFGIYDENRFVAGTLYKFPNGSFVKFVGLDKDDVGKGLRSDVAFFNEANKINIEAYRQVASRTKKVYIDFNPDKEFFVHTDVLPREDVDFIVLTFEDNEMLDSNEREEILRYKYLGYYDDGSIKSNYWANKWRVYGLGQIGILDGVIFDNYTIIDEIPKHVKPMGYGMDFGYTNPTAIVDVFEDIDTYYVDEILYRTQMTPTDLVNWCTKNLQRKSIVCDSAEPDRIEMLQREIKWVEAVKNKNIEFGLELILNKKIAITKRSINFINEIKALTWETKNKNNHLIDALRYRIVQNWKNENYGKYYY